MAAIEPLRALLYDHTRTGGLQPVVAPPYDVIDAEQRAALLAQSPHNVVEIDLPQGEDPYGHAAEVLSQWRREGVLARDEELALWALEQDYTGPDGVRRTRRGFFARVEVVGYGPGKVRPHERTHPGPKEDRLNLTRATHANLSPIFSLFDDPGNVAWEVLEPFVGGEPYGGAVTDPDGTEHRLFRVCDPEAIAKVQDALSDRELLIADGHHRYETARVYREEAPDATHVLMCLVALQDPGLTVFPTHRLLGDLDDAGRAALRDAIARDWDVTPLDSTDDLQPEPAADGRIALGYYDGRRREPLRLTLKDPRTAAEAMTDRSEPYRNLDTAVLEALLLKGALGMSEDDISHFKGIDYARSSDEAVRLVESGERQAAFFMGATPVEHIRAVAAQGENMPPKSTYFFPKVPTGMVFHLLGPQD